MIDVFSNNSESIFTPVKLRELARELGGTEASPAPVGYRAHQLSSRLSAEQIAEIVRRYEAGDSARTLAAEFDVASSALLRLLREKNVVIRRQVITPEQEGLMARDYEDGMTVAELREKHGVSHGAVLRALHHAGVEMRAKAPRRKGA